MGVIAFLLAACAGDRSGSPGGEGGVLAPCPASPNCVSSLAREDRHHIAPLAFPGDAEAAFGRLKRVLARRGDAVVVEEREGYLRAELRTRFFVDDAEFLLDREGGVIHVRSASRVGYWDLGKNRRRMEEIRAAFASSAE